MVFEDVEGDFSARLWLGALFKVVCFEGGTAFHGGEEAGDKIPGLGKVLVLGRDVKLPIGGSVSKLVLYMPINTTIGSVQLDKTIVAQCLIMFVLTYLVSMLKEVLVGEFEGKANLGNSGHSLDLKGSGLIFIKQTFHNSLNYNLNTHQLPSLQFPISLSSDLNTVLIIILFLNHQHIDHHYSFLKLPQYLIILQY